MNEEHLEQLNSFGMVPDEAVEEALEGADFVDFANVDEVNNRVKMIEAQIKLRKVDELLKTWKEHQESEGKIRKEIARWVFLILCAELMVGNGAFILYGFKLLSFPEWLAVSFFIGMYVQVISVVMVVVNGVFPKPKEDFLGRLTDIIKDL